ncbi:hypothetical protein CS0771_76730 [Catellatospora sp. IY07-71]|nr:hypothetical protein CS0771_76730 [Catellatospora sp. IY07-71]
MEEYAPSCDQCPRRITQNLAAPGDSHCATTPLAGKTAVNLGTWRMAGKWQEGEQIPGEPFKTWPIPVNVICDSRQRRLPLAD